MKKFFLLITAAIIGVAGISQTKRIAHESHSGKNNEFNINSDDNFGLPPSDKKTKKDSTKTTADSSKTKTPSAKKVIATSKKRKAKPLTKS